MKTGRPASSSGSSSSDAPRESAAAAEDGLEDERLRKIKQLQELRQRKFELEKQKQEKQREQANENRADPENTGLEKAAAAELAAKRERLMALRTLIIDHSKVRLSTAACAYKCC